MNIKKLFYILAIILILATIICSIKLEQKRLDVNEYKKFHDRFQRNEYINSTINLYTVFDFLGIVVAIYSIYNIWSFILYRNIDGKLYKIVLVIFLNILAAIEVLDSFQRVSYARKSVINEGLIFPVKWTLKPYLFAFGFLIFSEFFKLNIEKEYEKEVKKVKDSDYGKKWTQFNNKLVKK